MELCDIFDSEGNRTGRTIVRGLGIALLPQNLSFVRRLYRKDYLIDIWAAFADFTPEDIVMQEDEVDEVRLVTPEEMLRIVFGYDDSDNEYTGIMREYIDTLRIEKILPCKKAGGR